MSFSHENLIVYRRTLAFYVSNGVYNENRAIAIRSADQRQSVSTVHESSRKLTTKLTTKTKELPRHTFLGNPTRNPEAPTGIDGSQDGCKWRGEDHRA